MRDLQITNVSYSDPENLSGKKRSVLRVHYAGSPLDLDDDEDDEDEDDEDEDNEDEDDEDEDDEKSVNEKRADILRAQTI